MYEANKRVERLQKRTVFLKIKSNYEIEYIEVATGMLKDGITSQFYVDLNDLEINSPTQIPSFFYRGIIKPYYNFEETPIKTITRFIQNHLHLMVLLLMLFHVSNNGGKKTKHFT